MAITGGCRCGSVRYTIDAQPVAARHCWCRDCQYIGAGSGTVNVFFPSEALTVEGRLTDYQSAAASGNAMHRQSAQSAERPYSLKAKRDNRWSAFVRERWMIQKLGNRVRPSGLLAHRVGECSTPTFRVTRDSRHL